jgi:hypothetical protein
MVMSIEQWDAFTQEAKSDFLKNNRYFLQRFERIKTTITHVVFSKYDDNVIIK